MSITRYRHRRIVLALASAVALLLAACAGPQTAAPDPLATETPFSLRAANPTGQEGALFGLLLRPFQGIGSLATEDFGPFRNAFAGATLASDGTLEGSFIAPRDVPRVNDGFGKFAARSYRGGSNPMMYFFPPDECPMDATNAADAALAQLPLIAVWDGETLDDEGFPMVDAIVELGRFDGDVVDGVLTETLEAFVPVVSRTAWSASTDGACTFSVDDGGLGPLEVRPTGAEASPSFGPVTSDVTIDIEFDIVVGWQILHIVSIYTWDGVESTMTTIVRTLSLDDADVGDVWSVEPESFAGPKGTSARLDSAFALLFR